MLVIETARAGTGTRPDYAVKVGGTLVGFIELKAPGQRGNFRKFTDAPDKDGALFGDHKFIPENIGC